MAFGHEKLDVYRAAIEYVGWAYRFCETLAGHRKAKGQLLRASQAIPLNIAEGNGKGGYAVHEETEQYRTRQIDPDTDTDPDTETQP